ncbi:BRI1 kinase inhibitor 1 [Coffea eugenioides]|uniref:BRI1 kinase inhibitor 1 n=1 Tax=Coffea arabica TaxID=13443 RepID=A0A6P6UYZ9_COFAR|nr:BRI1 kinase inhibitor 1-like [Coffea arabica]XP_027149117.1 BRI1 kinase inhibitor 1 [Coffea eugenioides]
MEFMDSQHQKRRDKDDEKQYHEGMLKQGSKEQVEASTTASTTSAASPPSPSSSPSHEFSFTISLQPSSATTSTATTAKSTASNSISADKTKSSPASFALDLSPADDIFFHGHLLPLHLLSHLPVSPRSSTNSLDSFTLPIKELYEADGQNLNSVNSTSSKSKSEIINRRIGDEDRNSKKNHVGYETGGRSNKSKSFSLFGLSSKWRKDQNHITNSGAGEKELEDKDRHKRKLKLVDLSHVLKRYIRMVRPLLSFGSSRRGNMQFHRQSYSYSGNLSLRRKPEFRGRRGEFSAPASMRTSPTNSGLLVATGTLSSCSTSDSTMEELQAAIQAAIAHCKNSIAMEEKIKCHD